MYWMKRDSMSKVLQSGIGLGMSETVRKGHYWLTCMYMCGTIFVPYWKFRGFRVWDFHWKDILWLRPRSLDFLVLNIFSSHFSFTVPRLFKNGSRKYWEPKNQVTVALVFFLDAPLKAFILWWSCDAYELTVQYAQVGSKNTTWRWQWADLSQE